MIFLYQSLIKCDHLIDIISKILFVSSIFQVLLFDLKELIEFYLGVVYLLLSTHPAHT